jgi:hypothetical protein
MSVFDNESEYAGFSNKTPAPQDVSAFHQNSDKDSSAFAQHHTLGPDANQAAPGNHTHPYATEDHTHTYPKVLAVSEAPTAVAAGGWANLDSFASIYNVGPFVFDGADRLLVPVAGTYRISSVLYFDSLTAGYRASRFIVDGVTQEYVANYQSGAAAFISVYNSITMVLDGNSEVIVQGGAETAMNLRGSTSGLGLSRLHIELLP